MRFKEEIEMEYKVVYGHWNGIQGFENEVNRLIKEGWQPQGGIAVVSYREPYEGNYMKDHYFQAMIKE